MAGEVLQTSLETVMRDWKFANTSLLRELCCQNVTAQAAGSTSRRHLAPGCPD
jgi:hypothetical protein